jgi:mannose-6-phosphate isomerase
MTVPSLRPSTNPFTMARETVAPPEAEHLTAERQDKPWGHELIFAGGAHGYVGKLLCVRAGQALSLQQHRFKDETLSLVSGEAVFEAGSSSDDLERTTMLPGDTVHVPPTVLHRLLAVTDVVVVEASTADEGWRHDVVRVSDDYGRDGTSRP